MCNFVMILPEKRQEKEPAFAYSKLTVETVAMFKVSNKYTKVTSEVMLSLLLTLKMFHSFFSVLWLNLNR